LKFQKRKKGKGSFKRKLLANFDDTFFSEMLGCKNDSAFWLRNEKFVVHITLTF
jgi:hypothetical protein